MTYFKSQFRETLKNTNNNIYSFLGIIDMKVIYVALVCNGFHQVGTIYNSYINYLVLRIRKNRFKIKNPHSTQNSGLDWMD